nr:hypothetical protein [Actinomycetota bacterium]NIU64099.1 hypothetical protein [Actinomycetota bacterium]NIW25902.1 hypothetical protein [Actinomycetota bacterium]
VATELDVRDRLWVQVLRADIGLGRGDYREMADAAASARALASGGGDAAAACLAAHYEALVRLTDPEPARVRLAAAMRQAGHSGDARLATLVTAFVAAAHLAAAEYDEAHTLLEKLDREASDDGYDRFIAHWIGWLLGIAGRDAGVADRWMGAQQAFLDRTGIMETWISSFSAAMTRVTAGGDYRDQLDRALSLAVREGYRAEADCVLVLAYAEMCRERYAAAAELMGTAIRGRFNTTAHYMLYHVVLAQPMRRLVDPRDLADAIARGRRRTAAEALAEYGIPES